MKKFIIAMAAIVAAFTMASCNKELVNSNENPTVGKSVITASIENDLTKAFLEGDDTKGYEVYWSEGDKFVVFDMNESWGAEYTLDKSSAGSSKGAFIWQEGDFFITEDDYDEPKFENNHTYVAEYPSEIFNDSIWKTEQTYDETDIYIPMFGEAKCTEDGAADFTFTNLGGLLRLNVKGTATIKSIKVQAQEPMSGHILYFGEDDKGYKVAFISDYAVLFTPNTKNYINLNCGENGVKLRPEGTDFYISMPCRYNAKGEDMADFDGYSDVTITLTDTDGKTCVKKLNNKKLFIERSKITTATFTASEFKSNVPEGALPGKFSVSADKQVYFSKGNLWADGDNALHFEPNQNAFDSENGYHVSHFNWSDDVMTAVMPINSGSNLFCDKDHKKAVDGSKAIYYALSIEEWQYLFSEFEYDNDIRRDKVKLVTVNGVEGCVIAPDDFVGEIADSYADDAALAADNLVFLPSAGKFSFVSERFIYTSGEGYYWSSSVYVTGGPYGEGGAYSVFFRNMFDEIDLGRPTPCRHRCTIRLVTDCE